MSKQSNSTVVLAALSLDMAKTSARLYASAASKHAKADGDFMALAVKSVEGLPKLNAAQWDKQLRKSVKAELSLPKRGLSAPSVSVYLSHAKTLQVGAMHGILPISGESRKEAISRISEALATAKDGDAFVWPASSRNGRPAKAKGGKASGDKAGGAYDPSAAAILRAGGLSSSDASEEGFNRSAPMAAALILAKGNEARAQRVAFILASFPEAFDKWCEGFLSPEDKAKIAARSKAQGEAEKTPVVTLKPDAALPAVGAALVAAQRKANAKSRKAA